MEEKFPHNCLWDGNIFFSLHRDENEKLEFSIDIFMRDTPILCAWLGGDVRVLHVRLVVEVSFFPLMALWT